MLLKRDLHGLFLFIFRKEVLTDEFRCSMLIYRFCNGHSLYGLYY
nr:MAG TPA: hypothetical protein [Caudoviricetes sp.]